MCLYGSLYLVTVMRGPLRIIASAGLARAGGGRAESGEVAGGPRRTEARQHGHILRVGRCGRRLASPAKRARRRPYREHKCKHRTYRAIRRTRPLPTLHRHFPNKCIGLNSLVSRTWVVRGPRTLLKGTY